MSLPSGCADYRIGAAADEVTQRRRDGLAHREVDRDVRRRPPGSIPRSRAVDDTGDLHAVLGRQGFDEPPHPAVSDQENPKAQLLTASVCVRSLSEPAK